ncbi:hypothetical protein ASD12_30370 [Mesorhizobium sp. Root102]|nr:hypothetical protein ASD12_30370 [Mesorhizobium sp. Root102]
MSQQNLSKDDRIVVGLVMSRVDECDSVLPYQVAQSVKFIAMLMDFRRISPAEFLPAGWIVSEPFPKLGAWREFLHPMVDGGFGLLDPARPKPVNQDSLAIVGSRALICPFQLYSLGEDFFAHRRRVLSVFVSLTASRRPEESFLRITSSA